MYNRDAPENLAPQGAARLEPTTKAPSKPPHELISDAVRRSSVVETRLRQLLDDICTNPQSLEGDGPTPESSEASLASVLQATPGEIDSTTDACLKLIDELRGRLL